MSYLQNITKCLVLTVIYICFFYHVTSGQSFEDGELVGLSQFRLDELMKAETWDNIEYEGIYEDLLVYTYVGNCCKEIHGKEIENIALYFSTENNPTDISKPSGPLKLNQIHVYLKPLRIASLRDLADENELTNDQLKQQFKTIDSLANNIQQKINAESKYRSKPRFLEDEMLYIWHLDTRLLVLNLNYSGNYVGFKPVIQIISQYEK